MTTKWGATHRITFWQGEYEPVVWECMLRDDSLYTRDEWEAGVEADWTIRGCDILFQGGVAPGNGRVTVVRLQETA